MSNCEDCEHCVKNRYIEYISCTVIIYNYCTLKEKEVRFSRLKKMFCKYFKQRTKPIRRTWLKDEKVKE